MFRFKRKQVAGAGAEWFIAPRDKVVAAYEKASGSSGVREPRNLGRKPLRWMIGAG